MVRIPKVTMTMRELDRLKCVQGVVDRQLKLYQAAERLALTTRQCAGWCGVTNRKVRWA